MSISYQAVGWNRQKKIYDRVLLGGVVLYLTLFALAHGVFRPNVTFETVLIRALGTCALVLLHIILIIGPLCRLDRRFLPLLYNRRHMGVTMFFLALAHGLFSLIQFHALGNIDPLVSLFTSNGSYDTVSAFPFQPLGALALVILFLMAATSHDFWLANLTAPVWKLLHMGVYVAYALLFGHVMLGTVQAEPLVAGFLGMGMLLVLTLHLTAAWHNPAPYLKGADEDGYLPACDVTDIPEDRARIFSISGERVAIFRYDGLVSAISNVCQHQNGPLGEGKIIDGCVTCPWHGYQYRPADGSSPPPFTEKVPTFRVKVVDGKVWVHPTPNLPGTHVDPAPADV